MTEPNAVIARIGPGTEKRQRDTSSATLRLTFALDREQMAMLFPIQAEWLWKKSRGEPVSDAGMRYPLKRQERFTTTLKLAAEDGRSVSLRRSTVERFRVTPVRGGIALIDCAARCRPTPSQFVRLYDIWLPRGRDQRPVSLRLVNLRAVTRKGVAPAKA